MTLRGALVLVALCGFGGAAAGVDVRATYGAQVTADEPQYLLTALSLSEDASLDISDELAVERYRPFHEVALDRQTEPLEDGREISPHDPLLPLLLAVPMKIGGWVGAKLFLALLNGALAALLLWTAVVRLAVPVRTAALVVGLFVASAPLAVYGNQIYPELPAALAVAAAVAALLGPLSRSGLWVSAAMVVALPWLSVKYVPVAATLALAALWILLRDARRRDALAWSGGLAVAGLAYVAAHLSWYGGITVYATGDHFASAGEFSVIGSNVDVLGRARRLVGLLVDDKFGLAVWQPAYLLAVPATGALLRARPARYGVLLGVAAIGWLNATFVALTMQGWWWPGRQTVIVLPCLVLAVAWWVARGRRRARVAGALGALGVVSLAWIVVEGLRRNVTWVVDFFDRGGPIYRLAAAVTPDYLDVTALSWLLHWAWTAVVLALGWWGWRRPQGVEADPDPDPDPVPEPEPDPDPDSEPSTFRTPEPSSSPHAAPESAATTTTAASARFVPTRMAFSYLKRSKY